jgi:hypothetical protein
VDEVREELDTAGRARAVLERLDEHRVLTGGDPVVEVVHDVVLGAIEAERARELPFDHRRMQGADDVPAALLRLTEDARQSQEDYTRERQRTLQLASIARMLLSAHVGAHADEINNCASCAADWAAVCHSYDAFD